MTRAPALLVCLLAVGCGAPDVPAPAQQQAAPVISGARGPMHTLARPEAEIRTLATATLGTLVVVAWSSGAEHRVEVAISRDGGNAFEPPRLLPAAHPPGPGPTATLSVTLAAAARSPWPWNREPMVEVRIGSVSSGTYAWRSWDGEEFTTPEHEAGDAAGVWTAIDTANPGRVRLVPPAGRNGANASYLPSQVARRPSREARFLTAGLEPTGMLFALWHDPTGGVLSVHRYAPEGPGHAHGGATGEFDIPFALAHDVPADTRAAAAARAGGAFLVWVDADASGPAVVGRQVVFDQWCVPGADLPSTAQAAVTPGVR